VTVRGLPRDDAFDDSYFPSRALKLPRKSVPGKNQKAPANPGRARRKAAMELDVAAVRYRVLRVFCACSPLLRGKHNRATPTAGWLVIMNLTLPPRPSESPHHSEEGLWSFFLCLVILVWGLWTWHRFANDKPAHRRRRRPVDTRLSRLGAAVEVARSGGEPKWVVSGAGLAGANGVYQPRVIRTVRISHQEF
jgi:hypothetical protein